MYYDCEDSGYNYRSAVVDECGCVIAWVDEVGESEAQRMVDNHEEWRIACV